MEKESLEEKIPDIVKEGSEEVWKKIELMESKLLSQITKLQEQIQELTTLEVNEKEVDQEKIIPEIPQITMQEIAPPKKSLLMEIWNG